LSALLWPGTGLRLGGDASMSLGSYIFGTVFAGAPLLFFAGTLALARREAESHPAIRASHMTGAVAVPLFSLVGQVLAWKDAASDAQGALLFVFLPIYAAIASFLLMVLAFLFGLVFKR
jgi:ethanolamine transporter EutH